MRVCQRQRRHLWECLREWLLVPPFTRAFLKLPSSRGFSAIAELLVNLISMSQTQVHTWRNFGENVYEDIAFIRFFVSLPSVTLTFDLWCQTLISASTNLNTSVTTIWWNSLYRVVRYSTFTIFRVIACDLDVWPFNLISMSQTLIHKLSLIHIWRCRRRG